MACGPSAGRADLVGLVRHVPPWALVRSSTNASILQSHRHWAPTESGKHQPPCPVLHRVNAASWPALLDPRWIIQDDPHPPRIACSTDASGVLAQRSQRITRSASTARL